VPESEYGACVSKYTKAERETEQIIIMMMMMIDGVKDIDETVENYQ